MLTADKVLVTIGTPCSVSAVGTTETYNARVARSPEFIAYAAFDAGLINIEPKDDGSLALSWPNGTATTIEEIEREHGARLRANLGIDQLVGFVRTHRPLAAAIRIAVQQGRDLR